ncbi:5881_t:CDS:2 [Paraglomus occultum]|uniref:peptidylprolyl isomerase n=1 Tax=Paraglomus occultum TaxID=144539 RepID=A0A9N9ARG0_9GLOM|nr:5881_t:CDS:2 [Paraglomus occultum]
MSSESVPNGYKPLTSDNCVKKRIIREGNGPIPSPLSVVTVHYVSRVSQKDHKGNSEPEKADIMETTRGEYGMPITASIGTGQLIKGFDLIIKSMRVGELCEAIVSPEYAYGEVGYPSSIPPTCQLEFEVELLKISESAISRKLLKLTKLKAQGNDHYKNQDYKEALSLYEKALKIIEDERADQQLSTNDEGVFDQTFRDIEIALDSNMAACFLAQQNYKDAEKYCRKVLSKDPDNIKVIYRIGQAYLGMNEFEKGLDAIAKGLKIAPTETSLKTLQKSIISAQSRYQSKEKAIYSRMFSST